MKKKESSTGVRRKPKRGSRKKSLEGFPGGKITQKGAAPVGRVSIKVSVHQMRNTRGIGIQNSSPTQVAPSPYKSMDTNSFCDGLIDFQIPLVIFIRQARAGVNINLTLQEQRKKQLNQLVINTDTLRVKAVVISNNYLKEDLFLNYSDFQFF